MQSEKKKKRKKKKTKDEKETWGHSTDFAKLQIMQQLSVVNRNHGVAFVSIQEEIKMDFIFQQI